MESEGAVAGPNKDAGTGDDPEAAGGTELCKPLGVAGVPLLLFLITIRLI